MLVQSVIASLLFLSSSAGILDLFSGYAASQNVTNNLQIPSQIQSMQDPSSANNEYSPDISSKTDELISKLKHYANTISNKKFDHKTIIEIKKTYKKLQTDELYALSLPNIIQLSFNKITNKIGKRNFIFLMNLLNIKPLSMDEFDNTKFNNLDAVTRLLILSSRAIVHQYAMTNLFDYKSTDFDPNQDIINTLRYPWLQPSEGDYDRNCMLDNMKVIYEHAFDYLSHKRESRLVPLDSIYNMNERENEYLLELINKYGFIPWHRLSIKEPIEDREYDEYMKCYSIGTNVIFSEIMDDVHLPYRFLEGFDMMHDYKRNTCHPDPTCK